MKSEPELVAPAYPVRQAASRNGFFISMVWSRRA